MSTATESRSPVKPPPGHKAKAKPPRFAYLDDRPTVDEPALLTLHVGGKECDYWLRVVPSNFGEAFQLTKIIPTGNGPAELGEVYFVLFESEFSASCECKGFLRWGHCKHLDSLKALRLAGKV